MGEDRVVIVGAGPAGTRAAETLCRAGLRPVVLDEAPVSGGQIYRRQPPGFTRPYSQLYGFEAEKARRLHAAFDGLRDRLDYRPGTLVWAIADGAVRTASSTDGKVERLPYDILILATGATDRVIPFPGWTMAGVFTLGGAQIALKHQACAVGARTVFVGTGPLLYLVAYQYAKAGAQVAAVLDTTPFATSAAASPGLLAAGSTFAKGLYYVGALKARGITLKRGVTPLAAEGRGAVEAFAYAEADGREARIACDAVAFGYGLQSETQLADLAGCEFAFEERSRQWLPRVDGDGRSSVPGVYLAGDGARVRGADYAEMGGELAAHAALRDLGRVAPEDRMAALRRGVARGLRFAEALQRVFPVPHRFLDGLPDDTVLCRCEAIAVGELRRSAQSLGADELNRAKALTRVGMGRCQGRFCGLSAATLLAGAAGKGVPMVTRLRGQAPVKPLPVTPQGTPQETPQESLA